MVTVSEAEKQLAAARAEAARQQRKDAQRKLQELRREGAELLAELEPLAAQIRSAQNERLRLNGQLVKARNQINAYSQPLDVSNFPSDADIRAHAAQLRQWQGRQKELLALHRAAVERESVRPRAVALEKRLEQLRFEVQNWTVIAEGGTFGEVEGGVYQNVGDFIGSGSQVGPPKHL